MRRLSVWSRGLAGLLVPAAAALALAAKRLFSYVWSLSYVTDYELTTCTREHDGGVVCGYRIAFYSSAPCSGTIAVGYKGRTVTSRFTGSLCSAPPPPAPAPPAPTITVTTPVTPVPTTPTTTSTDTTPTTTTTTTTDTTPTTSTTTATTTTSTTSPTPAYRGVGGVHSLDSVDLNVVKLDDGSRWQVSGNVSSWVFDDVIEVAYANGVYTLTDNNAGSSVTATYLG